MGTHDMAIRISTIDVDKQTIMIDYLFDTSKLTAGTWFIYDPDVTAVPVPSAIPSSIPSSVPSSNPTISAAPSAVPSAIPSSIPSSVPSSNPSHSAAPSSMPIDSKSSATTTVKGSFLLLTSAVAI